MSQKVDRMSEVLNDPSLNVDPIPFDATGSDEGDEYGAGMTEEDIAAIIRGLKKGEGE